MTLGGSEGQCLAAPQVAAQAQAQAQCTCPSSALVGGGGCLAGAWVRAAVYVRCIPTQAS